MDNKKITDFIKNGLIDFIVICISIAYVLYSMVDIEQNELSVLDITWKTLLSIVVGFMIKTMLGESGINKGYASDIWSKEIEKYNATCNTANSYMERVDNFYYCEEIEKKKNYRKTALMGARMKYEMYFDKNGDYIESADTSKLTKKQLKVLKKAIEVKIYNLNLFSEYENDTTAYTKKETGDKEQRLKGMTSNLLGQIIVAFSGVYFVVSLNDWNWATFFSSLIQIAMWVSYGVFNLYKNYNYVVIEKVNKLKKKKELIQKFLYGCEKGMYTKNPYDEMEGESE